jgi:hypothetical protein
VGGREHRGEGAEVDAPAGDEQDLLAEALEALEHTVEIHGR